MMTHAREEGGAPERPGGEPPEDPAVVSPAPDAAPDELEEPPALSRWEEEGGIVVEEAPAEQAPSSTTDYKDRWLRAEAELANFRRRAVRDWDEARRTAEESVLLEIVGALDDLDRALTSAAGAGADEAWTQGVALVAQRMRDYLARQDVVAEDPIGKPFDPAFHEALLEMDAPQGTIPGTVIQVIHKGYRRGGRALRPARVVVARQPAANPKPGASS